MFCRADEFIPSVLCPVRSHMNCFYQQRRLLFSCGIGLLLWCHMVSAVQFLPRSYGQCGTVPTTVIRSVRYSSYHGHTVKVMSRCGLYGVALSLFSQALLNRCYTEVLHRMQQGLCITGWHPTCVTICFVTSSIAS
jgi:hypothetical protein